MYTSDPCLGGGGARTHIPWEDLLFQKELLRWGKDAQIKKRRKLKKKEVGVWSYISTEVYYRKRGLLVTETKHKPKKQHPPATQTQLSRTNCQKANTTKTNGEQAEKSAFKHYTPQCAHTCMRKKGTPSPRVGVRERESLSCTREMLIVKGGQDGNTIRGRKASRVRGDR